MTDISRDAFIKAVQTQAKVADTIEAGNPDDSPEFRVQMKRIATHIRSTLRWVCEDLDVDVRGVNLPWSECGDCGGEDGDHADGCPADKLAALGKDY